MYRVGAESRIQGTMQPPAFSVILNDKKNTKTNKIQNNEKELLINTEKEIDNKKLFLKKNKNISLNNLWEDGLIFDPKIFQKKTENFLLLKNLRSEENNDREKNENENNICVTPSKKKIITTSTTTSSSSSSQLRASTLTSTSSSTSISSSSPSVTSSSSSSSFSLLNYDRLIMKDIEGRCLETILRVKSFLKTVYQLSDEKCQSYNPDEKVNDM